ncbi:ComEC/Rec2 family competence protein [Psychrobacter arenosus]|uniref:ComEC/Rec2 family competence protein n=1 Tax=Psychrobacter arenosus TaxID=256326 RepID=UPI00191939D2|nr:ComEC/Rec2 family competence protein [Psychrobacter arenosus]
MAQWSATHAHKTPSLAELTSLLPWLATAGTQLALFGLGMLLVYLIERLQARATPVTPTNQASSANATLNPKPLAKKKALKQGLRYISAIVLIIISLLITLSHYYAAEQRSLDQSMRVTALVTIDGLSDSLYDPALDTGYRQVATLTHIRPLSHNAAQQMAAPWQFLAPTAADPLTISEPVKVLLSAYAYTAGTASKHSTQKKDPLAVVNTLLPDQQVWMTLVLRPIDSSNRATQHKVAASGFDSQRWLRTRHIAATAKIVKIVPTGEAGSSSGAPLLSPGKTTLRWRLRQHFLEQNFSHQSSELSDSQRQARAVTLSLLTGDRALITRDTKALYQLAGISHLLAISGTHVLFLAIILSTLVTNIMTKRAASLYVWLPRWQLRWLVMVVTAFLYAAFTGFDVPAARTAWMLVAIGMVRLSLVPVRPLKVLLALAVLMAWADPFVLWQVGYWLSFIAVALLLLYEQGEQAREESLPRPIDTSLLLRLRKSLVARGWQLIKLQLWLFIALLPLTLLLFGKVSLWGLIINLVAIGLYGMIIVPLNLLAGVCYLLSPAVATMLWQLVTAIVLVTHNTMATIVGWQVVSRQNDAWLYTPVNFGTLLIVTLILLPWLLPKGMLSRWLALPPLSLLIVTMLPAQAEEGASATKVYLLPTTESNLQVLLIKEETQQAHWLLLADYRNDKQMAYMTLQPDRVSERLQQQLGALGVKSLQGIVVQTAAIAASSDVESSTPKPDVDTNAANSQMPNAVTVATVATTLMQQIPVGQWWLAGELEVADPADYTDQADHANKHRALSPAVTCQVGQLWQTDTSTLRLKGLTGWPELNAANVASCAVIVTSAQPIEVYQFSAAHPLTPTLIATTVNSAAVIRDPAIKNTAIKNTAIKDTAIADTIINKESSKSQHHLLVDAANHQSLWSLWQLLCPQDVNQDIKSDPFSTSLLLTHTHSQLQEQQHRKLSNTSINQLGQVITLPTVNANLPNNTE